VAYSPLTINLTGSLILAMPAMQPRPPRRWGMRDTPNPPFHINLSTSDPLLRVGTSAPSY
jgi:hypothetical protein